MAGHVASDDLPIRGVDGRLIDDLPLGNHQDAVRQFQYFVEIFGYEQDGRAAISCLHNLRANIRYCLEIQPEARIGGDQHLYFLGQLTSQDGTLNVAPRQVSDRQRRPGRPNTVAANKVLGAAVERPRINESASPRKLDAVERPKSPSL